MSDQMNQITEDLKFLKDKIVEIEVTINELEGDLHKEVKPNYLEKLEKLKKEGKFKSFKAMEDYDEYMKKNTK